MTNNTTVMETTKRKEPWYLAIIAFFLLIFAANAVLVWLSVSSSKGLTIDKKYEHGIR